MATTHCLIVNEQTFKIHLEYMFAGTGSSSDRVDFNGLPTTALHFGIENKLVGMIADFGRVRRGDNIIFYVQATPNVEGRFYGVFKVVSNQMFYEDLTPTQYLNTQLGKNLTFRILIEPDVVYENGVSEWEALDCIRGMTSPNQMLWSLIYRKLHANRGNTMITIYEAERLIHLIRTRNGRNTLTGTAFSYDSVSNKITTTTSRSIYAGNTTITLNVLPRLISKFVRGNKPEVHLQAYITQNIGRATNTSLDNAIIPTNSSIEWIGNEFYCSVGEQRMDICLSCINNNTRTIIPIELKAVEASITNLKQIQRYIDWLELYYLPNRPSDIQPMLIVKRGISFINNTSSIWADFLAFDTRNSALCRPLSVIEYEIVDNSIRFHKSK